MICEMRTGRRKVSSEKGNRSRGVKGGETRKSGGMGDRVMEGR